MTDKIIKTSIRLPSSILKKLQMEAILEETSMQQIILRLIEAHLNEAPVGYRIGDTIQEANIGRNLVSILKNNYESDL